MYCHECAAQMGLMPNIPTDLAMNPYQLDKIIKHTMPKSSAGTTGVYTWPGSANYHHYTVTAVASGYVEVDDKGRHNIVWVGSEQTGLEFKGGKFVGPTNAVKVVCYQDSSDLHSLPVATAKLKVGGCLKCGRPLPY